MALADILIVVQRERVQYYDNNTECTPVGGRSHMCRQNNALAHSKDGVA